MGVPLSVCHYFGQLRLDHGGVATAVTDLSSALAERGHDVTVLTRTAENDLHIRGVTRVVGLGRTRRGLFGRSGVRIARELIAASDVLHLHEVWDPACWQLSRVARTVDTPYVMSAHGSLDDWSMMQKRLKKRVYLSLGGRRMLEQAAAVLCTGEAEASQSSQWYPAGEPAVLPLLMDLRRFEELPGPKLAIDRLPGIDHSLPRLLIVGRIHPKKGINYLIDAVALLRDEGLACNVVIAGTGEASYMSALKTRVTAHRLDASVVFAGYVAATHKVSLFEWADVFVLPTHQENWGIALFESLAAGTPVITSREVGVWRELEQTGGATITGTDPRSLADSIRTLLSDRPRLRARGAAARSKVLAENRSDVAAGRYAEFYRNLTDRHRKRRDSRNPK